MLESASSSSNMIIPKHSSSIGISNPLSALQKKVFNILIYKARNSEASSDGIYSISVNELKNRLGLQRGDKNNTHLKRQIEEIMKIVVKFDLFHKDKNSIWSAAPLLAGAQIKNGILRYSFSHFLKDKLLDPDIFTILDLIIIQGLSSKYSIALYENIKDFYDTSFPKIPIDKFRELMGVEDDKYKKITDLKKRVIETSVNEINEKTDLSVKYELVKEGRNYKYIKFSSTPSKNNDMAKFIEEMNSKIASFNTIFKSAQISLDDTRGGINIYTFESIGYNSKSDKLTLTLNNSKGKHKILEFDDFESAKSLMQKNLLI